MGLTNYTYKSWDDPPSRRTSELSRAWSISNAMFDKNRLAQDVFQRETFANGWRGVRKNYEQNSWWCPMSFGHFVLPSACGNDMKWSKKRSNLTIKLLFKQVRSTTNWTRIFSKKSTWWASHEWFFRPFCVRVFKSTLQRKVHEGSHI